MHKSVFMSALVIMSGVSQAELSIPGIATQPINALATTDKTLARTGLSVNEDDITNDQDANKITLTETQLHECGD